MNKEGTVINKYTIMNFKLCEINNILINNVNNYDKSLEIYKVVCKWSLVFDNDISIDVTSKVINRISVLRHNLEKYLKVRINYYRRQGFEISHISEMNITFIPSLGFKTFKHYMQQPMPMVERIVNRRFYKNNELIKTLDDIDLTLHMGAYEKGREDIFHWHIANKNEYDNFVIEW